MNIWHFAMCRPAACFVAKTYKMLNGIKGDKVFVNIVSSESIMTPSKTSTPEVLTFFLSLAICSAAASIMIFLQCNHYSLLN